MSRLPAAIRNNRLLMRANALFNQLPNYLQGEVERDPDSGLDETSPNMWGERDTTKGDEDR